MNLINNIGDKAKKTNAYAKIGLHKGCCLVRLRVYW